MKTFTEALALVVREAPEDPAQNSAQLAELAAMAERYKMASPLKPEPARRSAKPCMIG